MIGPGKITSHPQSTLQVLKPGILFAVIKRHGSDFLRRQFLHHRQRRLGDRLGRFIRDLDGDAGGDVIATGTPEKIIKNTKSYTAQYLKEKLVAEKQ